MADKGHEETEKLLKTLEGRVNREYKQAEKEVEAKLKDYLRRFKVKDAAKRKALKRDEITQEDYDKWRLGQIMIGKRWEEMRDTLAEDYLHAHEIAQGLAYDTAIDVYALNHNYGTYIAEKGALVDTSYTLYNHAAVERLIKERPNLLPDPSKDTLLKIKQGKIKRWSKQKITSAVTQGILQGEPLMDIAKRLRAVTNMDRAASIRNARTTVTNAQSAGRYDAFRRIKQMGLDPKVVWIATLDNHTRHEHRMLDGQMQEIDEPFEVEGKKILYPANTGFGDYKVPADLVYNCRCTIGVAYPGTKLYEEGLQGVDRFSRLGDMSYEAWKGIHEEAKETEEEPPWLAERRREEERQKKIESIMGSTSVKQMTTEQAEEFRMILDYKMSDTNLDLYSGMTALHWNNDYGYTGEIGAHYSPLSRRVNMDIGETDWEQAMGRRSSGAWKTKLHEELHQLDDALGHMAKGGVFSSPPATHPVGGVFGRRLAGAIERDILRFINQSISDYNEAMERRVRPIKSLSAISANAKEAFWFGLGKKEADYAWGHSTGGDDRFEVATKFRAAVSAFTDAVGLATEAEILPYSKGYWGHDRRYSRIKGMRGATSECFAEIGAHIMLDDSECLEFLSDVMPETVAEYRSVLAEIAEFAKGTTFGYGE